MMKRKSFSHLLAIGLFGGVLAGCSANEDSIADTSHTESAEIQSTGNPSSESSSVTSEETGSSGEKGSDEADSELAEEEAKDTLVDYIKENEPKMGELIDIYDILMEDEGDKYQANLYPSVSTDESKGRALIASYEIDKVTGKVEKTENENTKTKGHLSEIVSFNKEERRAHHEKLAAGSPEGVQDKVYEHLMLPGIHENTKKYEGRINPGESVRFSYFDEDGSQQTMYDPEVSEDGYFTMNLNPFNLKAGQDIEVAITGGYPEQQNFILTVNEAQEGMEDIRVRE